MHNFSQRDAAVYLAALIDGEGHIGCHLTAKGHWTRSIAFTNTDETIVRAGVKAFGILNLSTRTTYSEPAVAGWSPKWTVYLAGGRASFEKFSALVPLQSHRKLADLARIFATYDGVSAAKKAVKDSKTTPCETCGTPVYASPAYRARGGGRFCSVACRGKSNHNRLTLSCVQCGEDFVVIASKKDTAKFCSRSCMGDHKRVHQSEFLRGQAPLAAAARWSRRQNTLP